MVALRPADRLAAVLVLATTLAGVAVLPSLPSRVAVHFSAGGTPDGFVAPLVAVFLLPAVMLGTVVVVRVAAAVDPPADPRSIDAVVVGTAALLGTVHLFVLAWNLGYAVPMSGVVVLAVCGALALGGYVVVREAT
jgi:uncharacterized membrane protein